MIVRNCFSVNPKAQHALSVANLRTIVYGHNHQIAAPRNKVTHITVNLIVIAGPVKITGSKPKRRWSVIQRRRRGAVVAAKTKVRAMVYFKRHQCLCVRTVSSRCVPVVLLVEFLIA